MIDLEKFHEILLHRELTCAEADELIDEIESLQERVTVRDETIVRLNASIDTMHDNCQKLHERERAAIERAEIAELELDTLYNQMQAKD